MSASPIRKFGPVRENRKHVHLWTRLHTPHWVLITACENAESTKNVSSTGQLKTCEPEIIIAVWSKIKTWTGCIDHVQSIFHQLQEQHVILILWYCNFKQPAGALHCRLLLKLPRHRIDWIFYILRLLAVERSNPPMKPYAFNFMWAPTSTIPLQHLQSVRVLPGQWVSSSHALFEANSFRELSEGISNPSFTVIWRQSKYLDVSICVLAFDAGVGVNRKYDMSINRRMFFFSLSLCWLIKNRVITMQMYVHANIKCHSRMCTYK